MTSQITEFENRGKLPFAFGKMEYYEIIPAERTGRDIYIAVGIPWCWELTAVFARALAAAGHRVMTVIHPVYSLRDALNYRPRLNRPAAIRSFFKEKKLDHPIVIAHSAGFIDIMLMGPDNIGALLALNPAGLSRNNVWSHNLGLAKSLRVELWNKTTPAEEKKYYKLFLRQATAESLLQLVKEASYIAKANVSHELGTFAKIPVVVFRNNNDTIIPVNKVFDDNYRLLTGGGNHCGPFFRPEQMREIIAAVTEMEEKTE